jgi:hypothetical protein
MTTEAYIRSLTASARTIEQQASLVLLSGGAGNKRSSAGLAGVAAIVVAYINASEPSGSCEENKTQTGDRTLPVAHDLSIEPETRNVSSYHQDVCRDPTFLKRRLGRYV